MLVGESSVSDVSVTAAGNDKIDGGGGSDTIFGDNSNYFADASVGTASGNDMLDGGPGDDTLKAGPGNDALDGGANADDCDGEAGIDSAKKCEKVADIP